MSTHNNKKGMLGKLFEAINLDFIEPLLNLFSPRLCPLCMQPLTRGQRFVCTKCLADIPSADFALQQDNAMAQRVQAIRPQIHHAAALIYFIQGSRWQNIIHNLKYNREWQIGEKLGEWLGYELAQSALYKDVDCVVPLPLHPLRQLSRGFNQSYHIAKGVSKAMGIDLISSGLRRTRYNPSQVKVGKTERWRNVENLFEVTRPKLFKGRRILLVDDVFTTGATILSCAEELLDRIPDCELWIATIAVSHREFGVGRK